LVKQFLWLTVYDIDTQRIVGWT